MANTKLVQFMMACREEQVYSVFNAEARVHDKAISRADSGEVSDESKREPYIMQVVGNVAIIEIKGKLISSDSPYNRFFGLLSYDEIRRAYSAAYENPDVQQILEDYDTPGGYVTGMQETRDFMNAVGRVKPRTAFVGASACSAGYFLAMNADKIYAGGMAEIGSVGVVMVNMEYTDRMKMEGITATVIRSGDLKMVGNPYEKLSERAKKYFTDQVMYAAGIFYEELGQARSMSAESLANNDILSGRTFIGKQAVEVGLADGVDSFDNILASLQKKVDNSRREFNNGGNSLILTANGGEMKKVLSAEHVAALAAGVSSATDLGITPDPEVLKAEAERVQAEQAAADEAAKLAASAAETKTTQEAVTVDVTAIDVLNGQLAAANDTIKSLEKNATLAEAEKLATEAKVKEAEATGDALKTMAADLINNMRVALGNSAEDLSALTPAELVTKYAATQETFKKAFPVGGVSGSAALPAESASKVTIDKHQIKAVGFAD
jgi:capsid assembly protease